MSTNTNLTGKVAGILNSRELAINIGANAGVEVDMVFKVLGESELKDPDSGEDLGVVRYEKGRVKIVKVEEKFAIARTFETYEVNIGGMGFDFGGLLDSTASAEARLFAPPQWITRVQTLKYEHTGLELPERKDETSLYIKVGDVVELTKSEG